MNELSELAGGNIIAFAVGKFDKLGIAFDYDDLGFQLFGNPYPLQLLSEH